MGMTPQYKTPEEMQEVINIYFSECIMEERPFTVSGLAYSLHLTRQSLCNYEVKPEFLDTIKRAKQKVELSLEEKLVDGKAVAGIIFNLKNNYGYKDKTEQEITGANGGAVMFGVEFVETDS